MATTREDGGDGANGSDESGGSDGSKEIDRFDGGVGWIAEPDEDLQRASHALVADGDVWVIDPVDTADLDRRLNEFGGVALVSVQQNDYARDVAQLVEPPVEIGRVDRIDHPDVPVNDERVARTL